ncbi:AMP-binding protein [Maricurvus nonylphenolicus]|uniref:AMP-binding protein n=1 Tax=Maricurvus nonylphenolicus TaxID=1008307 RepID=UPI0036F22682
MTYVHPIQQFLKRVEATPHKSYLHQPKSGQWKTYSWSEVDTQARTIATALQAQGFEKGDRIAILAKNSMEWIVADLAIAMAGLISVPIYSTAGEDTIAYVLAHSGSKAIFVGKLDGYEALNAANPGLPTIGFPYPGVEADIQWLDWLQQYSPQQDIVISALQDTYTIVYTSGSTGNPKGVVLTAENLVAGATAVADLYPSDDDSMLSYLPMAHITERCLVNMCSLFSQVEIFFNESLDTFLADLQHAKPTIFLTVPRLWAKFQAQILAKMPDKRLQRILSIPLIGRWFAGKIRKQLGFGSCLSFGSGTAPISPSLLHWWGRLGVDIAEGWGMTEISGAGASNSPFETSRLGTIGVPLSSFEFKLADNGELLVRGDSVFKEYYKNPEATADAFEDGWFKTGDKAKLDANGSWSITGRVKEQFKTAKGKYVAPVPIESLLEADIFIEQSCVVGSGMSQPVGLVVISEQQGATKDDVEKSLVTTLNSVNKQLESHERLDHIVVAKQPWSIENGLLTPTLKLKRSDIEQQFTSMLEQGFSDQVIWQS